MKKTFLALLTIATLASPAHADRRDDVAWARDLIRRADLDLAKAVREHSETDFKALLAEDATCFGGGIARGREACMKSWTPIIKGGKSLLQWAPDQVTVSSGGDLGYSIGKYTMTVSGEYGKTSVARGTYVTIWRRDPDNRWRLLVDIGTEATPDETPAAAAARARALAEARSGASPAEAVATINPAPTWKQELARQAKLHHAAPAHAATHAPSVAASGAATGTGGIDPAPTWQEELARQKRRREAAAASHAKPAEGSAASTPEGADAAAAKPDGTKPEDAAKPEGAKAEEGAPAAPAPQPTPSPTPTPAADPGTKY